MPAHNILSTDMPFHVQLPIKTWDMQMRLGALVYNSCTVSASQISLMTSSHSAEWKKWKEQRKIPPGSWLQEPEVFTFDFHIYSLSSPPPPPLPKPVFLNNRPKNTQQGLLYKYRALSPQLGRSGHPEAPAVGSILMGDAGVGDGGGAAAELTSEGEGEADCVCPSPHWGWEVGGGVSRWCQG